MLQTFTEETETSILESELQASDRALGACRKERDRLSADNINLLIVLKRAETFCQKEYCNRKAGGEEGYIGEAEDILIIIRDALTKAEGR
jgi:hypothetical protein